MTISHIQTRESIRAHSSFPMTRLEELVPPEGNTPRQVSLLPIKVNDVIWGLVYSCGAGQQQLVAVACKAARRVATPYSVVVVEMLSTTEKWLRGEATSEECQALQYRTGIYCTGLYSAAKVKGYSAALSASTAACSGAFMDEVYEAFSAAACSAGYAAGDGVPKESFWEVFKAAWDQERQQQISDLVHMLESDQ